MGRSLFAFQSEPLKAVCLPDCSFCEHPRLFFVLLPDFNSLFVARNSPPLTSFAYPQQFGDVISFDGAGWLGHFFFPLSHCETPPFFVHRDDCALLRSPREKAHFFSPRKQDLVLSFAFFFSSEDLVGRLFPYQRNGLSLSVPLETVAWGLLSSSKHHVPLSPLSFPTINALPFPSPFRGPLLSSPFYPYHAEIHLFTHSF